VDTHQEQDLAEGSRTKIEEEEQPRDSWLGGEQAVKFLLAGGIAGAGEFERILFNQVSG
jgi:hypothetical protein